MKNTLITLLAVILVYTANTQTSVLWTELGARVAVIGDNLERTVPGNGWNLDRSARSFQYLPEDTDGWCECTVLDPAAYIIFGFSDNWPNSAAAWVDIDHATYQRTTGEIQLYESSTIRSNNATNWDPGDVFRVSRTGGVVTYIKNGTVYYNSSTPSTSEVVLAAVLHSSASILGPCVLSSSWVTPVSETMYTYDEAGNRIMRSTLVISSLTSQEIQVLTQAQRLDINEETSLINSFELNPNPTSNFLTITASLQDQSSTISILDMTGRLLTTKTMQDSKLQLDMSPYDAGSYVLLIQSGSDIISKKIIKN